MVGLLRIGIFLFWISAVQAQVALDTVTWAIDFHDVVVTAQYAPTDARSAIHPIRVLDKALISRRFAASLDDLLAYDAGIRIRQDMVLGSALSLLGQDGQSVKILLDGVPVIGRMNGNVDLNQLPLHQIQRIEVVEGPLSVQYGTDALGGVINIITRPAPVKKVETSVRAGYESMGESRMDASIGGWVLPKLMLRGEGGLLRFNGFAADTTRDMLWNPKEQWYAGVTGLYQFNPDHRLRYRYQLMDETITNLGVIRRPQFKPYAFDDYYYTGRQDHSLHWNGIWAEEKLHSEVIVAVNAWDRVKRRQRTEMTNSEVLLIPGEQDTNSMEAYHFRATVGTAFSGAWNGMVGTEWRWDIAEGNRIIDPEEDRLGYSRMEDRAVFGSLRYRANKWLEAETGLRWAVNSRFKVPIVPSIHLKADIKKGLVARASYARGFRAPTAKELYFEFLDANHFILGSPDLRPESSDNVQVSVTWDVERGYWKSRFRLMGFYNDVRDRIGIYEFYELNGERIPTRGDTVTLRFAHFNYQHFRNHGVQMQVRTSWKGLEVQGSLLINGYHEPEHTQLMDVPSVTYAREFGGDISYQFPKWQTTLSLMGRHYDRLIAFYPEKEEGETVARQRTQDGFSLLDMQLNQPFWKQRIRLHFGVRNLLNIQRTGVLDTGASLQHNQGSGQLPVSPGRTWFVGLEWRG